MGYKFDQKIWIILRLAIAGIFLWAFFDKVFGLGFATEAGKAWIDGVSPTYGYLKFATKGPFASFYQSLAGNVLVDWLFMIGLLGIGIALLIGAGMNPAGYLGALLMIMLYMSVWPPEHHPFLDEHIVYALVLLGLTYVKAGQWFGIGKWWIKTEIVKKYKFLE